MGTSIKLNDEKYIDTSGVKDSILDNVQSTLNSKFNSYVPVVLSTISTNTITYTLPSQGNYLLFAGDRIYLGYNNVNVYLISVQKATWGKVIKIATGEYSANITSVTLDNQSLLVTITFNSTGNKMATFIKCI